MSEQWIDVGAAAELRPGDRQLVRIGRREVGLFNRNGRLFALPNKCPHQGAPLCLGTLEGTTLPSEPQQMHFSAADEVIRCPWHGWEFDIRSGRAMAAGCPGIEVYEVEARDGRLWLRRPG